MKKIYLLITVLSLFCVSVAQAEKQPLESLSPVELIQKGMKDDAGAVWGLRVLNTMAIGEHRSALQALAWCSADNKNDAACMLFARIGGEAETKTSRLIQVTDTKIKQLKSQPHTQQNDEHLKILESQLETLKGFPTPFNDMLNEQILKGGNSQ